MTKGRYLQNSSQPQLTLLSRKGTHKRTGPLGASKLHPKQSKCTITVIIIMLSWSKSYHPNIDKQLNVSPHFSYWSHHPASFLQLKWDISSVRPMGEENANHNRATCWKLTRYCTTQDPNTWKLQWYLCTGHKPHDAAQQSISINTPNLSAVL